MVSAPETSEPSQKNVFWMCSVSGGFEERASPTLRLIIVPRRIPILLVRLSLLHAPQNILSLILDSTPIVLGREHMCSRRDKSQMRLEYGRAGWRVGILSGCGGRGRWWESRGLEEEREEKYGEKTGGDIVDLRTGRLGFVSAGREEVRGVLEKRIRQTLTPSRNHPR